MFIIISHKKKGVRNTRPVKLNQRFDAEQPLLYDMLEHVAADVNIYETGIFIDWIAPKKYGSMPSSVVKAQRPSGSENNVFNSTHNGATSNNSVVLTRKNGNVFSYQDGFI